MNIEKKVKETISKYKLLNKKDNVVVALSGGKDSTSILYILHRFGYNVSGLMIDLHLGEWSKKNKKNVEKLCEERDINLTVVDLKREIGHGICFIKSIVKKRKNLTGCTVCGVIKRWILNKWARKLKADKIVTGHNLDDETQTVLMNFLKGNIFLGVNSTPETGTNKKILFKELNLYFLFLKIKKYSKKRGLPVLYERCPCAYGTYRVETRAWLDKFSNDEKLKIVEGFQNIILKLRKKHKSEVMECSICGEPSRGKICKACKIFECVKE